MLVQKLAKMLTNMKVFGLQIDFKKIAFKIITLYSVCRTKVSRVNYLVHFAHLRQECHYSKFGIF
jgi:hypothetical protein